MAEEPTVIGLVEPVAIIHGEERDEVKARIDTGATRSSIDLALASKLRLGPVIASKVIRSANGAKLRPMVEATVELHGKRITATFTLADREQMQYQVLIGQNILKRGFLIDPNKE